MRTTHGTADVSVAVNDDAATLGELIAMISGRRAPPVVLVDGRIVDTARPIGATGLRSGSEIDTDVDREPTRAVPRAALLQLTGSGAGTLRPLPNGTYRIGPGVRLNVDELVVGRVDRPVFEMSVGPDSTVLRPVPLATQPVTHDGRPLTGDIEWSAGLVIAGGRTFAHERGPVSRAAPVALPTDDEGRMLLSRQPVGERGHEPRLIMIDPRRDAELRRPALWAHRTGPDSACRVAVGIDTAAHREVEIDITADPVVVLAGDVAVASAHARSLVVDAATRYGPADLDIAVAAEADQIGQWEWLKWLPHATGAGIRAAPQLLGADDHADLAAFATARLAQAAAAGHSRRTLLVVVGDALWSAPRSPLHRLVTECPPEISLLLVTERRPPAPDDWSAIIEHPDTSAAGHAVIRRRDDANEPIAMLAPLPTTGTAAAIARRLSALVDPEAQLPDRPAPPTDQARTLRELVGGDRAGAVVRWHARVGVATPALMPVGLADSGPVCVDLGLDRGVVISATSLDDADAVARTLLASMATAWSPHELAIVWVDHRGEPPPNPLHDLAHHAGTFSEPGSRAGRRFVSRLATELLAPTPTARRVAVVVRDPAATDAAAPGLVENIARLANAAGGIHLVIATDAPVATFGEHVRANCSISATVDRVGGVRRASASTGRLRTPFALHETPSSSSTPVEVEPWVIARPLTSLERHVARLGAGHDAATRADRELERLVRELNELAGAAGLGGRRSLVPAPLPDCVSAATLSHSKPADGVPLGLVARLDADEPVLFRWRPGRALSLIGVGNATSGVRALPDLLLRGVLERYVADDVQLFVADADDATRAAAATGAPVLGCVAPTDEPAVAALLDELAARATTADRSAPALVIVRELEALSAANRARLAAMVGADAGLDIHIVAATRDVDAATSFPPAHVRYVVGALDDPADYAALGVDDPSDIVGPGRCLLGREQLRLQLAEPPESPPVTVIAPSSPGTFAPPSPSAAQVPGAR